MKNLICKEQYCRSFICNVDIPEPFDVCFPYVKREDSPRHAFAHENTVGCSSFEISFPSHSIDVASSSNPIRVMVNMSIYLLYVNTSLNLLKIAKLDISNILVEVLHICAYIFLICFL